MPVTNTFNNRANITKAALKYIENNCVFMKHVNRGYDDQYRQDGAKSGDTANIRIPGYGTYRSGKVAQPTGNNETYVPVVLQQGGADFQLSSKEKTLNVDEMITILGPRISSVVSEIDRQGLELVRGLSQTTGTPGTAPTNLKPFTDAFAKMAKFGAPIDDNISAILDFDTQSALVDGLGSRFQSAVDIARQYREGNMGIAAGMKFSADQIVPSHTVGTFGSSTPVMAANSADGDATISTSGWASGASTLNKGDVIQIAGVYAVNAVTKQSTGKLMDFVVTATTSDSSGAMATLPISPALTLTGPNQNISALPLSSAKVYVFGKNDNTYSGAVSALNVVFHKDAFVLASADLAPVPGSTRMKSSKLDFSIRVSEFWDGRTDDQLYRLDVLFGWATLRPQFACRVQG